MVVPVSGHGLSGHTLHTPRVTVVVPVSGHRLTRKQNKNQPNEKMKNTKTNHQSHRKSLVFCSDVSLPVANKLLCSVVSLPVANKLAKDSVKHPDDKWLMDVLTKTLKCQPAASTLRESLLCHGHGPVTASILRESLQKQGHSYLVTPHILRESLWWSLSVVTSHLVIPYTLRESLWWSLSVVKGPHTSQVTVDDHGSRLARQQNKNKQNEKYKNQKSNYLSNVTLARQCQAHKVALSVSSLPRYKCSEVKVMVKAIWSYPTYSESHCSGPCQWSPVFWSHPTHSKSHCSGPCQRSRSWSSYSASHC